MGNVQYHGTQPPPGVVEVGRNAVFCEEKKPGGVSTGSQSE